MVVQEKGIKGGNQKKDVLVDLILTHDNQQDNEDSQPTQPVRKISGKVVEVAAEVDGHEDEPHEE